LEQRITAFKAQDQNAYLRLIMQASQAFQKLLNQKTQKALEHLDLSEQDY
jgi:hypothetical protein